MFMAKAITATDAVRKFSDLLNTIRFKGERYTILRGGKPIATLGPAMSSGQQSTLGELSQILKKLPKLGDEAAAFDEDLRKIAKKQPTLPRGRTWV
jgi:antitoxin (DNA-binding transcriptional repressor) of toxin-antitoxin stability system